MQCALPEKTNSSGRFIALGRRENQKHAVAGREALGPSPAKGPVPGSAGSARLSRMEDELGWVPPLPHKLDQAHLVIPTEEETAPAETLRGTDNSLKQTQVQIFKGTL